MKTKTPQKYISYIQKVGGTLVIFILLFAACTLFTSCGQDSSGENILPMPESMNTPLPSPIQNAADSSWIFLHRHEDTNDISDFVSTEELDAAMSLAYDSYNCPQLFARYHGRMNTYVYVIDLIQLNSQQKNSIIRLQFYSSPYRMEHPKLVQELCILIPHTDFESIENGFEILDLNEDYHDDFRLELGSDVKNVMSFYFVYDPQKEEYTYLGEFAYTTFFPEEQILYENSYATHDNLFRKYKIIGTEAILMEQVHIVEYTYSYKKRTGDELTTIIETTSYEDFLKYIDISEWSNIDWPSPEY